MTKREVIATLFSPLVIVPIVALYAGLFLRPPGFMTGMSQTALVLMTVGVATFAGYVAAFAVGLPLHKLLKRGRRRSIWAYLTTWLVSAIVAWACVMVASFSLSYLVETLVERPLVPLAFGVLWAIVGGVFWLVVRPDRDR